MPITQKHGCAFDGHAAGARHGNPSTGTNVLAVWLTGSLIPMRPISKREHGSYPMVQTEKQRSDGLYGSYAPSKRT